MKNNLYKFFAIIFFSFVYSNVYSAEQFNFNVTEVEILEKGNKFIGTKRGEITTNDGVVIDADQFEYDKKSNILNATGNVKLSDTINNYIIFTDTITYLKNENIIFTKRNSKALSLEDEIEIIAEDFEYNRELNIITAKDNVTILDKLQDYKLYSNFVTYHKLKDKVFTKGKTSGLINSKYEIDSADIILFRNSMELISNKNTTIKDKKFL